MLVGCDQIVDISLGHISKTKTNDSTLTTQESSLKSLGISSEENFKKKIENETKSCVPRAAQSYTASGVEAGKLRDTPSLCSSR